MLSWLLKALRGEPVTDADLRKALAEAIAKRRDAERESMGLRVALAYARIALDVQGRENDRLRRENASKNLWH